MDGILQNRRHQRAVVGPYPKEQAQQRPGKDASPGRHHFFTGKGKGVQSQKQLEQDAQENAHVVPAQALAQGEDGAIYKAQNQGVGGLKGQLPLEL